VVVVVVVVVEVVVVLVEAKTNDFKTFFTSLHAPCGYFQYGAIEFALRLMGDFVGVQE